MLRKRVAILEGRHELSFDEFDEHWATGHAAIISELPGLSEYVQNSVLDRWTAGEATPVDGIVEVWFDDEVVSSPERHTSTEQQDDEVVFIRTLTAVTVTDRRSYDSVHKVWVLSPTPLDEIPSLSLPAEAISCTPEADAVLMERPRLRREPTPPQAFITVPTTPDRSRSLYDDIVQAFSQHGAPDGLRVLRTRTRRIR